jgi:hypothetical protein
MTDPRSEITRDRMLFDSRRDRRTPLSAISGFTLTVSIEPRKRDVIAVWLARFAKWKTHLLDTTSARDDVC